VAEDYAVRVDVSRTLSADDVVTASMVIAAWRGEGA